MSTDRRPGARARGYDAAHEQWRLEVFRRQSHCQMCGAAGRSDDHADHITPIRQGGARFDPANGARLCRSCHVGPKQSQDRTGRIRGCDVDGTPIDPRHNWRRNAPDRKAQ